MEQNGQDRIAAAQPEELEPLLPLELFSACMDMKKFNRTGYPEQFEEYLASFRPALDAFERNAADDPDGAAERLSELLYQRFLAAQNAGKRQDPLTFRFTIALLAVPSVLSLGTAPAERAADLFLKKWNAAFPKTPIGKATYEQVCAGFRKKLCYIVTAAGQSLGADGASALDEFRAFRDGWLVRSPGGPEKIAEYYLFAPMIVRAIDSSGKAENEYRRIWDEYLAPCLRELRSGEKEACARDYENMVLALEQKWFS